MNTIPNIIQIELEEAIDLAWKNFQNGNPIFLSHSKTMLECFRLCFIAGFLDGVKMKNVSDQLGKMK